MKSIFKLVPYIMVSALMTNAAQASDGSINFQGRLIAQTCTIAVGGVTSETMATVTLPTVSASMLDAVGKTAGRTDFEIELSNCSGSASSAAAYFQGGSDVDLVTGELINRSQSYGGANVRLRLIDNSNNQKIRVGDNSQLVNTTHIPIVGGNATLPYAVEYVATGVTTSGHVWAPVVYNIDYQ